MYGSLTAASMALIFYVFVYYAEFLSPHTVLADIGAGIGR